MPRNGTVLQRRAPAEAIRRSLAHCGKPQRAGRPFRPIPPGDVNDCPRERRAIPLAAALRRAERAGQRLGLALRILVLVGLLSFRAGADEPQLQLMTGSSASPR